MSYQGDIHLGDTIDIHFCTVQSTGAPTTLAGSPVISAYVGNSTTEITAGITLTVDFDSRTGLNNVRVVATSGNGYTAATNIDLVITTGTVNSVSAVGYVVGSFSIDCRGVNQWNGTAVAAPATAGIPEVNIKNINNVAAATPGAAGGVLIAGTNAATTFSASGVALTITSSGGNGQGLSISGNGSGAGMLVTGGATGPGLSLVGGGTSGDALLTAATSGHGATFAGAGTTKHGINATGGSTTSHGISATGGGVGHGILATSGGGSTGDGIKAVAASTNGNGMNLVGVGTGAGKLMTGGGTGIGMSVVGGGTSGDGIKVVTTSGHGINLAPVGTSMFGFFATGGNGGTSDGMKLVAGTGGVALNAASATMAITGNITGNLSGSVGSVTGAVGSVTGAVGSVTGAVGSVTGSVGSIATGGITTASFAAAAIDSSVIATSFKTAVTANIMAYAFGAAYGSYTFEQLTSMNSAVLLAKVSGLATTTGTFRNIADTANVVVATIDANGNRTAVTLTP